MRRHGWSSDEDDREETHIRTQASKAFTDEELSRRFAAVGGEADSAGADGLMDERQALRMVRAERESQTRSRWGPVPVQPAGSDGWTRSNEGRSRSPLDLPDFIGGMRTPSPPAQSAGASAVSAPPAAKDPTRRLSPASSLSASREPVPPAGAGAWSPSCSPGRARGADQGVPEERKVAPLTAKRLVQIVGLRAAPHLNGSSGTLERLDDLSGRWEVKLANGDIKAIKPENLLAANVDAVPQQAQAKPAEVPADPIAFVAGGVGGLPSATFVGGPPATTPSSASTPAKPSGPSKPPRRMGTVRWYNGRRKAGSIIPDGGGPDIFIPAQGAPNGSQVPPQPGGLFHGTRVSFQPLTLKPSVTEKPGDFGRRVESKQVVCMDVRALQGQPGLTVGVGTNVGAKESNDDRVAATDLPELGFFSGVFDGHRGASCADYLAKNLPTGILSAFRARVKRQGNLLRLSHAEEATLILKAMVEAFEITDKSFLVAARKKEWKGGSTAAVGLIVHGFETLLPDNAFGCSNLWPRSKDSASDAPRLPGTTEAAPGGIAKLLVAWCGDCRIVLLRNRQGIRVTEDHRPNRPEERKRIQQAGGMLAQDAYNVWRCGPRAENKLARELQKGRRDERMKCFLSTSRGFGDSELKHPDPVITVTPEVKAVDLVPEDWAIIMGSDGLFDRLTDQNLANLVWESMVVQGADAVKAAKDLVQAALRAGALDNITAVVMRLGWAEPPGKEATFNQSAGVAEPADRADIFG